MKSFSTPLVYQQLLWIQAGLFSFSIFASDKYCEQEIWYHAQKSIYSVKEITFSNDGLRIEKVQSRPLNQTVSSSNSDEPSWLRASRQSNQERALAVYSRRGWPQPFLDSLRAVDPKVAPYSRWINVDDSDEMPIGGISLVASEMLCIRRIGDPTTRCSGDWSDFEAVLVNPQALSTLAPIHPLAVEILYPGAQVPRMPHRAYELEGYSFSFNRVYELRHYFLRSRHPLREQAREEIVFAVFEWMFRDFSNDGDDMFRWPPPGMEIPCIFSYGDQKSIKLYGPLSMAPSHDWSNGSLENWYPLSTSPLELMESMFFWPQGERERPIQSAAARRRYKQLRDRYFPPEHVFSSPRGIVIESDIFKVRTLTLKQSGFIHDLSRNGVVSPP